MASSFTLGRFLSGYFWGCFADRIGRKPVVIIGLLSITTGSIAFGTSRTYSMALASKVMMNCVLPCFPFFYRKCLYVNAHVVLWAHGGRVGVRTSGASSVR